MKCSLCPRKCCAERTETEGNGFCREGTLPKVARAALHYWEEPCISGKNGSGAIFFSGCTLRCVFCQNYEISAENFGRTVTVEQLIKLFDRLAEQGANNINLVSGTQYIPAIAETLKKWDHKLPVVYNTGGYERVESLKALEGLVDIYLPDLKYIDSALSARLSGAEDYFSYASAALEEMLRQTGEPIYNDQGIMQRGTIVRHLILPGHTANSIEVLRWIKKYHPTVLVSLMAQYLPWGRAKDFPEINRPITAREYDKVLNVLFDLGLDGFVQERSSAKKKFVPSFQLEGLEGLDESL